jgi:asparagine synthase (glutamine-hydrolysing)
MCGITGFTHDGRRSSHGIRISTETLRHRGPDELNVFESRHVSLGAVRLKILDLTAGQQPMASESDDCVLVFNGEIYNHVELRVQLEGLGHSFRSNCDTEVVLRAFEQWDVHCFLRFRGMFAAAFWQERTQRLVLVRDRIGIKPLYYAIHEGQIYFGSELKAILQHGTLPRLLSREALAYYLCLNYIPGPATLIEGIQKVPPASWLEWRNGKVVRDVYWRNEMRPRSVCRQSAESELDGLLGESVREHLKADVPVGIWLSGGLDSATILHYAAERSEQPLRTFSVSFRGRRCDESKYSRPLAAHYGTHHEELDLSSDLDLESAIHELSYYSDEPSADAGAIPVWFLSKLTAGHVRVALSGEGSDEIFGGYQTYLADNYAKAVRHVPKPLLKTALRCAGLFPPSDRKIGFEYKLKRFLEGSLLPSDEAHFFWNGTFSEENRGLLGFSYESGLLAKLVRDLGSIPADDGCNRYLFIDQHFYLPDDILYKCDRMSMAHALEVRPPFLDHALVEFANRLPADLKIRGSETKVLLRGLMRKKLPRGILNPRKEGLDIPAHEWLRGPLRPLLLETLSREAVEAVGLFSYSAIEDLITAHCTRRTNLGYHLWGLLTLHLWIRRWKIQIPNEQSQHAATAFAAATG